MIESIRSRALKRWWERGDRGKINPDHFPRVRRIMLALDAASSPSDMNIPGFGFHALKGNMKGHFAVTVTGNWRITFSFEGGNATQIDYLDYHGK